MCNLHTVIVLDNWREILVMFQLNNILMWLKKRDLSFIFGVTDFHLLLFLLFYCLCRIWSDNSFERCIMLWRTKTLHTEHIVCMCVCASDSSAGHADTKYSRWLDQSNKKYNER